MKTYFNTRSEARTFAKANGLTVQDSATNNEPRTQSQKAGNDRWYVEQEDKPVGVMTLQQVFDKVATHLLKQNERAMVNSLCSYRGENNTMCAAGCLIKDEYYKPELESLVSSRDEVQNALILSGVPQEAKDLIRELQRLHDSKYPAFWSTGLKYIAKIHNLSTSVVK